MYFLQTAQAPAIVKFGKNSFVVPKLLMEDIVAWGVQLYEERYEKITENMNDTQKREYDTFYPSTQPDLNELKRMLRTPAGIEHVIRAALPRAQVRDEKKKPLPPLSPEQIDEILTNNGGGRLAGLAWVLADLNENSILEPPAPEEGTDPLPASEKSTSNG